MVNKIFKFRKLKCHALLLTVLVSLLLSIFCLTILFIAYRNRQQIFEIKNETTLTLDLFSANNILLADTNFHTTDFRETVELNDIKESTIEINRSNWGFFQLARAIVKNGSFSKGSNFLIGCRLPDYFNSSIYVTDHRRPISMVGVSNLVGDAYISELGFMKAFIDEMGFKGSDFLKGEVHQSKIYLPPLRIDVVKDIPSIIENTILQSKVYNISGLQKIENITNSFNDSTITIASKDSVELKTFQAHGKIIIRSLKHIQVGPQADLQDVILFAPSIHFEKGFTGTVQAFTTDSLICDSNSTFFYPSVLAVMPFSKIISPLLKLKGGSDVSGFIFAGSQPGGHNLPIVLLENKAKFKGIVFVKGYLSPLAKIEGCVMTDYFLYKTQGVDYVNYLVNPDINRQALDSNFLIPSIFFSDNDQKVVKWLH